MYYSKWWSCLMSADIFSMFILYSRSYTFDWCFGPFVCVVCANFMLLVLSLLGSLLLFSMCYFEVVSFFSPLIDEALPLLSSVILFKVCFKFHSVACCCTWILFLSSFIYLDALVQKQLISFPCFTRKKTERKEIWTMMSWNELWLSKFMWYQMPDYFY